MESAPREISWKALEHHHFEKTIEWFLILAIMTFALAFSAFYLDNFLLGMLIVLGGVIVAVAAGRRPRMITHAISARGIRIGHQFFPHKSLHSYSIDEEHRHGPHLLVLPKQRFAAMLVMPIPADLIDDIEDILQPRLEEGDLEEPFFNVLLEILRF